MRRSSSETTFGRRRASRSVPRDRTSDDAEDGRAARAARSQIPTFESAFKSAFGRIGVV